MQLKYLKAFLAVANAKSFSEASLKTGIPQPTLSRLIKQLEENINVVLIDRYQRPLQLTKAGRFFYNKIGNILKELDSTVTLTQRIDNPPDTLSIGFVPSVLYGLLPIIIAALKKRLPNLDINLKDISSFKQPDALKSGSIDVGFGRFAHENADIEQRLLRHERYIAALPKAHPLSNKQQIHLNELKDDKLILYHQTYLPASQPYSVEAPKFNEPLLYIFHKQSVLPFRTTEVSDIQVALGLVAAGEGVTLVPDSLKTVRNEQINYCPIIHEDATSPIYINTLIQPVHPALSTLFDTIYAVYEDKGITYRRYASPSIL